VVMKTIMWRIGCYMDNEDEYERELRNNHSNAGSGIVGLIVIIALCWWGYNHFLKKDYSKPWWTGTQSMKVCDANDDDKCYTLPVSSDGKYITRVGFPNGGYIIPNSSECAEAASFYDFDSFCTFWETNGTEWDVLPH